MTRVLLVDDNEDLLEILQIVLESEGFDVTIAHSPVRAALLAQQSTFDVLVTDQRMPSLSGEQLIEQVRVNEHHRDIRAVLMSGLPREPQAPAPTGCVYLKKPFETEELLKLLRPPAA